jgi:hypothetical protein
MKVTRKLTLLALMLMVAMLVAACGGDDDDGGDGGESGASPESVASSLFESLFSGDTDAVANLVCEEQRDAAVEALGTLGEDTEGVEIDTSGLEFESTEDGDTATVAVSGELSLSIEIDGETMEESADVSELGGDLAELPMIREDGNWVFCPTGEDAFGG